MYFEECLFYKYRLLYNSLLIIMQIFDQMQLLLLSVNSQSILIIGSGSGFGYGTSFEISALVCFVFQFCNKCMVCVLVLRRGSTLLLRPL